MASQSRSPSASERYEAAIAALDERGVLYECFCSRADVRRAASAPHGPEGPLYPGVCRELPAVERARLAVGQQRRRCERAWRARSSSPTICKVRGASGWSETSGDIVVRRSDGVIAYQLAVVVDDAAQGVTHVVRGADLLASTARQLELRTGCWASIPSPGHAHVPCYSATTASVSPSATARSAWRSCAPAGADPRTVVGWLAHSAGLLERAEPCTPAALVETFAPSALERDAASIRPDACAGSLAGC